MGKKAVKEIVMEGAANAIPGGIFARFFGKIFGRVLIKSGAKRASGELKTLSGKTYHGNSTGSSASGGTPRAPMNQQTQEALDGVQNPSRTHGHCCELDAINKALNAGDDVRGATMGPVQLNESGRVLLPCSTCREVMSSLGVE